MYIRRSNGTIAKVVDYITALDKVEKSFHLEVGNIYNDTCDRFWRRRSRLDEKDSTQVGVSLNVSAGCLGFSSFIKETFLMETDIPIISVTISDIIHPEKALPETSKLVAMCHQNVHNFYYEKACVENKHILGFTERCVSKIMDYLKDVGDKRDADLPSIYVNIDVEESHEFFSNFVLCMCKKILCGRLKGVGFEMSYSFYKDEFRFNVYGCHVKVIASKSLNENELARFKIKMMKMNNSLKYDNLRKETFSLYKI